ncbi:MAG: spore protease YyaC [Lachnospiraceae bacterium]|nr:spore protease YyaC [Lachnospiraceae bacterium]
MTNSDFCNYVPFTHPRAAELLAGHFRAWREAKSGHPAAQENRALVFFCIGTVNVPGDSLGPLVGEALTRRAALLQAKSVFVTGSVREPIHALNLAERYTFTRQQHPDALIVAVDAGLGLHGQVGSFAMWEGSLSPGIALDKDLPPVGDFGIAGIVGTCGSESFQALQNASPRMVKKMADRIAHAICRI